MGQKLDLMKHQHLHEDGRRLISTWFDKAWQARDDSDSMFESFVFAWISVNAWAACVTGQDVDRAYMDCLKSSSSLRLTFDHLRQTQAGFRSDIDEFFSLLPIFKAQCLRRRFLQPDPDSSRSNLVRQYFEAGLNDFEPECARLHFDRDEPIPRDWPHFIAAVYRVRCNLFHGEKSAHSEMDRQIVKTALRALTGFFRGAKIL